MLTMLSIESIFCQNIPTSMPKMNGIIMRIKGILRQSIIDVQCSLEYFSFLKVWLLN